MLNDLENPINYIFSKEQIISCYMSIKDELNRLYGDLKINSFIN